MVLILLSVLIMALVLSMIISGEFGRKHIGLTIRIEFRRLEVGKVGAWIGDGDGSWTERFILGLGDERSCKRIQGRTAFPVSRARERGPSKCRATPSDLRRRLKRNTSLYVVHFQAETSIYLSMKI
jgi:hypothetical protein